MTTDAAATTSAPAVPPTGHAATDIAIAHAAASRDAYRDAMLELLAIPSVSTQAQHAGDCRAAAQWLATELERIGLEHVELCEPGGHPIVYADWLHAGADAPTVLVYGHYDVQPPDPLEEWRTPPFEPTIVDGDVFARGAADDKGQLLVHVKAIESLLATEGALPVNVRFAIEGEEESGSGHLDGWVAGNAHRLAADVCLVSDSHMLSPEQPSLISSLRGMAYCEVTVHGPTHDLHSGTFGGGVRNPAEALARMLATCKDDDGHITVPGFYDDVRDLTVDERAELARVPFDDASFLADAGLAPDEGFGEAGFTTYERVGARPTLEVNGMWGGYTEPGAKTVLPARAAAKVSMRLVADQEWRDIAAKFEAHMRAVAPVGTRVEVESLHGGNPSRVDPSTPALGAARRALAHVFGVEPVMTREGGSIPVVTTFDAELGIPTVLMGFGLPDDRLHSPNEKFSLAQYERGIATAIVFLHELRQG